MDDLLERAFNTWAIIGFLYKTGRGTKKLLTGRWAAIRLSEWFAMAVVYSFTIVFVITGIQMGQVGEMVGGILFFIVVVVVIGLLVGVVYPWFEGKRIDAANRRGYAGAEYRDSYLNVSRDYVQNVGGQVVDWWQQGPAYGGGDPGPGYNGGWNPGNGNNGGWNNGGWNPGGGGNWAPAPTPPPASGSAPFQHPIMEVAPGVPGWHIGSVVIPLPGRDGIAPQWAVTPAGVDHHGLLYYVDPNGNHFYWEDFGGRGLPVYYTPQATRAFTVDPEYNCMIELSDLNLVPQMHR